MPLSLTQEGRGLTNEALRDEDIEDTDGLLFQRTEHDGRSCLVAVAKLHLALLPAEAVWRDQRLCCAGRARDRLDQLSPTTGPR
eukprot:3419267-Rhodomonas_salina.3